MKSETSTTRKTVKSEFATSKDLHKAFWSEVSYALQTTANRLSEGWTMVGGCGCSSYGVLDEKTNATRWTRFAVGIRNEEETEDVTYSVELDEMRMTLEIEYRRDAMPEISE